MTVFTHHAAHRFERCASQYDRLATVQQRVVERLLTFSQASTQQPAVVLDLGSGTGDVLRSFAEQLEPKLHLVTRLLELDISASMLQVSRQHRLNRFNKRNLERYYVRADMSRLPIASQSVHRLYSSMALQWSSSVQQVCQEIARVLTGSGEAFLAIPVAPSLASLAAVFAECEIETERIYSFATTSVWLQAIANAGLDVEQSVLESFSFSPSQGWQGDGWRSALKSLSGIGASAPIRSLTKVQYQRLKQRLIAHHEPQQLFRFNVLFLQATRT